MRGFISRTFAIRKKKLVIRAQSVVRMHIARHRFLAKSKAATILQTHSRAYVARKINMPQIVLKMKQIGEDRKRLTSDERAKIDADLKAQAAKLADTERQRQDREKQQREEREREEKLKNDKALEDLLNEIGSEIVPETSGAEAKKAEEPKRPANADDFEATMTELQNFINGEVFSQPDKSRAVMDVEKGISLNGDQIATTADIPAAMSGMSAATRENAEMDSSGKMQPFNVYLNYNNYKLQDYAMNHFNQHEKSAIFGKAKKVNWTDMLQHTKKQIPNSMTQFKEDTLIKEAVDNFGSIMKYMGDLSGGKNKSKELIQDIIGRGLQFPELRDEIFVQLCKQTTKNPKVEIAVRGWELMALSCGAFLPTKGFLRYLCAYIQSNISGEGDIGRFASFCLKRLTKTLTVGTRRFPPSTTEIEAYKTRKAIIVRIHLMDGKVKAIEVDCSSTVSEVFNTVVEKIGLKDAEQFAIYEAVDYMERSLREAELIGDVLAKWEKNYTNVKILKIVFKKKIYLVPQEDSRDPVAKDLIFHQAVYDVISGRLAVSEQDALKLAGYQMQCFWGDFDPSKNFAKQLT
jgi:hypothetical protein